MFKFFIFDFLALLKTGCSLFKVISRLTQAHDEFACQPAPTPNFIALVHYHRDRPQPFFLAYKNAIRIKAQLD